MTEGDYTMFQLFKQQDLFLDVLDYKILFHTTLICCGNEKTINDTKKINNVLAYRRKNNQNHK